MEESGFAEVSEKDSKIDPYPFVYVKNNGSYRELTDDEKAYLQEQFYPADGGRPYIKSKYKSVSPDMKMKGFLKRSKLPKGLAVGEIPNRRKWWQLW